jgi:hypothetical protein
LLELTAQKSFEQAAATLIFQPLLKWPLGFLRKGCSAAPLIRANLKNIVKICNKNDFVTLDTELSDIFGLRKKFLRSHNSCEPDKYETDKHNIEAEI